MIEGKLVVWIRFLRFKPKLLWVLVGMGERNDGLRENDFG